MKVSTQLVYPLTLLFGLACSGSGSSSGSLNKRFIEGVPTQLKAAGVESTVNDETEKRKGQFSDEAQAGISKLFKYKFGDTSVQLSAVVLSDPSKKVAVQKSLDDLFKQLQAADGTYKRAYTSRLEAPNTAMLLVHKPEDEALVNKLSPAVRLGARCPGSTKVRGQGEVFEYVSAVLNTDAIAFEKTDVTKDFKGILGPEGQTATQKVYQYDFPGTEVKIVFYEADSPKNLRFIRIDVEKIAKHVQSKDPTLEQVMAPHFEGSSVAAFAFNKKGSKRTRSITDPIDTVDVCMKYATGGK